MDASASQKVDANCNDVYSFFIKIEDSEFPTPPRQRSAVIKYTKLPECDFETLGSWPRKRYELQPRLRRIITVEEPNIATGRSLKPDLLIPPKVMTTNISKRKIVTISEDDENDLHPKFSNDQVTRKSYKKPTINKSIYVNFDKETKQTNRTTSRPPRTTSPEKLKETKTSAKGYTTEKKEVTKTNNKNAPSCIKKAASENARTRFVKDKETVKSTKGVVPSKSNISKNYLTNRESEKEMSFIRAQLYENPISRSKKNSSRSKLSRSPSPNLSKASFVHDVKKYSKPIPTVIHVPLEEKYLQQNVDTGSISKRYITSEKFVKSDFPNDSNVVTRKDANIATEPLPQTIDQSTDTDGFHTEIMHRSVQNTDVQTVIDKEILDSLDIPNVSLKTDRRENKMILNDVQSKSLPNLEIPSCQITPNRNEKSFLDTHYYKSTSYIISRATLTYKTKQKINFHVVGSNDNTYSNQSPSPLSYPMNVVSVFKEESSAKDISNDISMEEEHNSKSSKEFKNCINEIKSLDCSYVSNSNKLMKPSDIISTITVNNGLLQSDYICEQFQRELNFIDSFFESLQYLESCLFADKCFKDDKINVLVNQSSLLPPAFEKDSEYENFLSKFDNGANSDDSETMASKNLLLLNILIRDEQRRAKNLLLVLKRREDALKDFTKSQILYLESKKKQENTDISALKKKQRGALLKLQHECGEMQRMRKALLTLSEKRKVALMKTKKDLELKLKSNVGADKINLGKKKLKRNSGADRSSAPLKCFELSSSGCEDSTTSRGSSESTSSVSDPHNVVKSTTVVEKSIQTGDSILDRLPFDQSTNTAAENFVVVDGGYLNILFQNLTLPQIFSGGKQYEVNEEALKNIVNSSNKDHKVNGSEAIEKLMEQINNSDSGGSDKSSSPSTARSLVEEFDQYYKGLAEDEKSFEEDISLNTPTQVFELNDASVQASACILTPYETQSLSTKTSDSVETVVDKELTVDPCVCEVIEQVTSPTVTSPVTGPLLPPVGAPEDPPTPAMEIPSWLPSEPSSYATSESSSVSSEALCELTSSITSIAPPVHTEAEELRRQQLAIEQEIKELEQQQCRLLVVREIPDKPPPPYTPPQESRPLAPRTPRPFRPDNVKQQIRNIITDTTTDTDPGDPFNEFVQDFCVDSLERLKPEQSDKPWDSCNLLPQKPPPDLEKVIESTSADLVDVLAGVPPVAMSGVSSRRSDHIDDILFAEWRRIEPEWTSLHTDEAVVKNQLFETIFQKILTETVDEYKQTVLQLAD